MRSSHQPPSNASALGSSTFTCHVADDTGAVAVVTGCDDYVVRVFSRTGELQHELHGHTDPVFAVSSFGVLLLSGGYDGKASLRLRAASR